MSRETSAPTDQGAAPTSRNDRTTALLLACGVVAGPLFVLLTVGQAMTREGFDPALHPLSLLSLGDLGWLQIANFAVSGVLVVLSAIGLRRAGRARGDSGRWGPILIGVYGSSLIWAGVFVTDPAEGYPVGTPQGPPTDVTWHGMLHNLAPVGMGLALVVACVVLARRFAARGRRGWAVYSVAAAVGYLVLSAVAFGAADFRWMLAGGALVWTWAAAVCAEELGRRSVAGSDAPA